MITKERALELIAEYSERKYDFSTDQTMTESQVKQLAEGIVREVTKADDEWRELAELKTQNAQLQAENEVYKNFLLSANYKLPKESKNNKSLKGEE